MSTDDITADPSTSNPLSPFAGAEDLVTLADFFTGAHEFVG